MRPQWILLALIPAATLTGATTEPTKTFATAEEARDALIQAAAVSLDAVRALFGTGSGEIVRTGDKVEDERLLEQFNQRAREKTRLEPDEFNPNRVVLLLGEEEWPFAVPLKCKNGRWYFDIQEGRDEIRYRSIGGNELDAIEVCRGYVEAQEIYAVTDWDGDGVLQYARRVISSPEKKDGLYWPGEDSPVAQAFAKAVAEGYKFSQAPAQPQPFHGYLFRILTAQGPRAAGGARDYIVRDLMIGGFALVAWPAEYGISGLKTFIVNQDGIVYEKDLGRQTAVQAKAMTTFNPDDTWEELP